MTTELFYLVLTAILAALLWVPYVVGFMLFNDPDSVKASFVSPPDIRAFPAWIQRSYRAHQNLVEQFAPFAVVLLVAHVTNASSIFTQWAAILFFWLRIAHAIVTISGFSRFPLRSIIFHLCWILILIVAWQTLANTPSA